MKTHLALAVAGLAIGALISSHAAEAATVDLAGTFDPASTTNGDWSYSYSGNPALTHQPQPSGASNHLNPAVPAAGFLGAGPDFNVNTPFIFKSTKNGGDLSLLSNADFHAGDIIIHSPNDIAETLSITWTAPTAGTISDLDVSVWYAHSNVERSNDVSLTFTNAITTTTLASWTLSNPAGAALPNFDRDNPATYGEASRAVNAGDLLTLTFQQAGGGFGSLNGVAMSLNFVATTPIPGALPLFASALGGLGFFGWRRKRSQAAA